MLTFKYNNTANCSGGKMTRRLSRRGILAATAAGGALAAILARAASFGNPDLPPEGAVNVTNPEHADDPRTARSRAGGHDADLPRPAGHRCRQHAGVLGLVQPGAAAHPGRRLGAAGDAVRFRHLHRDRRRQHAPVGRRHPRAALAPAGRVVDHDLRPLPHHGAGRARPPVRRRRQGRRSVVFPGRPAALPAGPRSRRGGVRAGVRQRRLVRVQHPAGDRLDGAHAARGAGEEFRRPGRGVQEHSAAEPLDLPGQGAASVGRGAGGDRQQGRQAGVSVRLLARQRAEGQRQRGGYVQIADSSNFHVSTTDRGRPGDGEARRACGRCTGIRTRTSGNTT